MIDEKRLVKEVNMKWREDDFIPVDRFLETIECQPKIGEWIPCSDRLPEEGQNVILQDYYGDITIARFGRDGLYQDGFYEDDWFSTANNYLAWQPLPEPYKEKN